ncbi:hypothetical protein BDV12DRAFT_193166 [Aspergillus spectabilis]
MAPPSEINIRNLTGDWVIDKHRTENLDAALKLQGIGWLRRKAVTSGTITLKITQFTEEANASSLSEAEKPVHLMMQQGLRGIFPGVEQTRVLNWTEHEHVDAVSGAAIVVRSQFVNGIKAGKGTAKPVIQIETAGAVDLSSVEAYLASPVTGGEGEDVLEKAFVQDFIRCEDGGWTAEQVWAVERVGDDVFLSCRAVAVKGSSIEKACLVYKYEE